MLRRRWVSIGALVSVGWLVAVPAASAHAVPGKQDLPIPRWLFAWSAALVLVASFIGLAVLWQQPRLQRVRERVLLTAPRLLEPLCGLLGVAAFVAVVYAGLAGEQNYTSNLAFTAIFVIFWVGIPFASVLFGDVFAAFNPWRAVGRAGEWVLGRSGRERTVRPYPAWLGRWPAAAGLLVFAWVELADQSREDPSHLAVLALGCAAVNLAGIAVWGERRWTADGDSFGVYFRLISRLSPFVWKDRRLGWRVPGVGLLDPAEAITGTVALVMVAIGSTTFDGFSQGDLWNDMGNSLARTFRDIGFGDPLAAEAALSVGLLLAITVVSALYVIGVVGMESVDRGRRDVRELARTFAPTLVPIVFAYVFAHYFTLLIYNGQSIIGLLSDPLGDGSDLFGTAGTGINNNFLSPRAVWYFQAGALVIGHVAALALAHERALTLFREARVAARSQYWMLTVMIGFTSLGLWLLSLSAG